MSFFFPAIIQKELQAFLHWAGNVKDELCGTYLEGELLHGGMHNKIALSSLLINSTDL